MELSRKDFDAYFKTHTGSLYGCEFLGKSSTYNYYLSLIKSIKFGLQKNNIIKVKIRTPEVLPKNIAAKIAFKKLTK